MRLLNFADGFTSASTPTVTTDPAAGSSTYLQYNNAGVLGADANLTYDFTNSRLYVGPVGIPAYALTVTANASHDLGMEIRQGSSASWTGLHLTNNAGSTEHGFFQASSSLVKLGSNKASSYLEFYTNNALAATLTAAGNLGIGVSPSYKLDVAGTARISTTTGSLRIESTTTTNAAYLLLQNSTDSRNAYVYSTGLGVGLIQADNTAGSYVYLSTKNTERMRIDGAGNVGINQNTPKSSLHINSITTIGLDSVGGNAATLGFNRYFSTTEKAILTGNRAGSIEIGNNGGALKASVGTQTADTTLSTYYTYMTWGTSNDIIAFNTGNTERMRIDSSGNVGVGLTPTSRNNTTLQIKDGIGFPTTQVSSSDANTLDDYEEGTFTPSTSSTTGSITTLGTQVGKYTKIGDVVTVTVYLPITTNGTGAGVIKVSNMPFSSSAMYSPGVGREMLAVGTGCFGWVESGTDDLYIQKYDGTYPGGSGYAVALTVTYKI